MILSFPRPWNTTLRKVSLSILIWPLRDGPGSAVFTEERSALLAARRNANTAPSARGRPGSFPLQPPLSPGLSAISGAAPRAPPCHRAAVFAELFAKRERAQRGRDGPSVPTDSRSFDSLNSAGAELLLREGSFSRARRSPPREPLLENNRSLL